MPVTSLNCALSETSSATAAVMSSFDAFALLSSRIASPFLIIRASSSAAAPDSGTAAGAAGAAFGAGSEIFVGAGLGAAPPLVAC